MSVLVNARLNSIFVYMTTVIVVYVGYLLYVSPTFAYLGFAADANPIKFILAVIFAAVLGAVVPFGYHRVSEFQQGIFVFLLVAPILAVWAATDGNSTLVIDSMFAIVWMRIITSLRLPLRLPNLRYGDIMVQWAAVVGFLLFATMALVHGGLRYVQFGLSSVYKVRADINTQILVGVDAYLWGNLGKSLLLVAFAVALARRKRALAFSLLIMQLLLFALTSHKELLFYPLIFLGFYELSGRIAERTAVSLFFWSVLALSVGVLCLAAVTAIKYPASLIMMRAFVANAANHFRYFDFFADGPHLLWSNSILSHVFHYPFDQPVGFVIGASRSSVGDSVNANAGIIANGFMHAGAAGVALYATLAGIVMKFYDLALPSGRAPLWVVAGIGFVTAMQFISADLPASLLTHGVATCLFSTWAARSALISQPVSGQAADARV